VILDFDAMVAVMETERPLWKPGTRYGYHAVTFGWLVGEVIRRVAGESVGSFFRRMVAEPLHLDFWIGLPDSEEHRVAKVVHPSETVERGLSPLFDEALERREPIQLAVANSYGNLLSPGGSDAPGVHAAEIPAANGITNARGLAGMYAPLSVGGELGRVRLVGPAQLAEMGATESASLRDAVLFASVRHSAGFEKGAIGRSGLSGEEGLVLSEAAFGHGGLVVLWQVAGRVM